MLNYANRPSNSFSIPDDDASNASAEANNFSKSSFDDINTSFVNGDSGPNWEFKAGEAEQTPRAKSRSKSNGHDDAPSPVGGSRIPPSEPSGASDQHAQPADGGFNTDSWSDQFGPHTFVPQTRTSSSASPTKTTRTNSRKSKTTKPVAGDSGNNAILVDDSSDEDTFTWRGRKGQAKATSTDSPQAMDIDSPPAEPSTRPPQSNGARNIPVEPTRPEWRSGNFNSVDESTTKQPDEQPKPHVGGSEDTEEFQTTFAEFKNVAPFAQGGAGLKSFSDMKDNLPFESKASDEIPIETKVPTAQPLVFPNPPQAPRPPLTMGVPNMKTNVPTWEKYVQEFEQYMQQWDIFSWQVTDHFAARKTQITGLRREKGYSFLQSRSDADCLEYFKSVQQDNDVRRRWAIACEEHEERLKEFMTCREKMK